MEVSNVSDEPVQVTELEELRNWRLFGLKGTVPLTDELVKHIAQTRDILESSVMAARKAGGTYLPNYEFIILPREFRETVKDGVVKKYRIKSLTSSILGWGDLPFDLWFSEMMVRIQKVKSVKRKHLMERYPDRFAALNKKELGDC